jgi:Fibronectin type III domain
LNLVIRYGLLSVVFVLAACGKRGDPLPPLRRTPQPVTGLSLSQRGEDLTFRLVAPRTATDGSRLPVLDVEVRTLEGEGDFAKAASVSTHKAAPGERLEWSAALPAPGTLIRVAAVAVQQKRKSVQTAITSLLVQPEPAAPTALSAHPAAVGVALTWEAPKPMPMWFVPPAPPPSPSPSPSPSPIPAAPLVPKLPEGTSTAQGAEAEAKGPSDASPTPTSAPAPEPEATVVPKGALVSPLPGPTPTTSSTPAAQPAAPRPGGFLVYRRSDPGSYGGALAPQPTAAPQYTDLSAALGSTVCYSVRTVISTDPLIESRASAETCLTVHDVTAPAAPTGLTTLAVEGGIEVSWSPSPESDLVQYRVYRAPRGGGASERIAEVAKPIATYRDTAARSGQRYRYTVTAVDGAGNESPASAPAEAAWP